MSLVGVPPALISASQRSMTGSISSRMIVAR